MKFESLIPDTGGRNYKHHQPSRLRYLSVVIPLAVTLAVTSCTIPTPSAPKRLISPDPDLTTLCQKLFETAADLSLVFNGNMLIPAGISRPSSLTVRSVRILDNKRELEVTIPGTSSSSPGILHKSIEWDRTSPGLPQNIPDIWKEGPSVQVTAGRNACITAVPAEKIRKDNKPDDNNSRSILIKGWSKTVGISGEESN